MNFRLRFFTDLLFVILFTTPGWAKTSGAEVILTNPGIAASEVKRRLPELPVREVEAIKPIRKTTEPTQAEIARALDQASLTDTVTKWDILEKDLFALRAQKYPIEKLKELYPALPLEKIRNFQMSLRGER